MARISLPRLWAGPNFNTGNYQVQDAAYGFQTRFTPSDVFDTGLIYEWVNDVEVDGRDLNPDDGRELRDRFQNTVLGAKFGLHLFDSKLDVRGAWYSSDAESYPAAGAPDSFFGIFLSKHSQRNPIQRR